MFRETIIRIVLVFLGILVSGLIFEVGVRVFTPQNLVSYPDIAEPDLVLGFKLKSNFEGVFQSVEYSSNIKTNSLGFRDREYGPKEKKAFRILGLGDSFTWAAQVEAQETYLKVLEALLNKPCHSDIQYEVINAGGGGWGPEHYLLQLKENGMGLEPDIVIVGFFAGNDVGDRIKHNFFLEGGRLVRGDEKEDDLLSLTNSFLGQRSHAYLFLRTRFNNFLWRIGLRSYYFPWVFYKVYQPQWEEDWQWTFDILEEIDTITRDHGASLLIVIIPKSIQVQRDQWEMSLKISHINEKSVDLIKPNRMLIQFGEDMGIPILDLLPYFQDVPEDKRLYYEIDRHMNAEGHKMTGHILYDYIIQNSMNQ